MVFTVYVHGDDSAPAYANVVVADDGTDAAVEAWVCDPEHEDYEELSDMVEEYGGSLYKSIDDAYVALVTASIAMATPAWTRAEGKNKNGGLNEKGRKSYPGHLKRPQAHGKRHKSFCARMKGMRAKMKNQKKKRDPKSRINLSLKKWNC
jgi:hypothetical protein